MKSLFQKLMENALFSDLSFNLEKEMSNYSKEVTVFDKGEYKTEVTHFFDKSGALVGSKTKVTSKSLLPTEDEQKLNQLMMDKHNAVENEEYELAAKLHSEIKSLEEKLKK